jgi:hypothetical protein
MQYCSRMSSSDSPLSWCVQTPPSSNASTRLQPMRSAGPCSMRDERMLALQLGRASKSRISVQARAGGAAMQAGRVTSTAQL